MAVKGGRGVGGFEGKRTGRHLAMLENLSDTVTTATADGRWLKPTPTLGSRGVGLGSRTHGFLGVDHLLARAQVITVHSVIAGALVVCRCCIWACHIG